MTRAVFVAALVLSACVAETATQDDVAADVEALTTCWDTAVAGTTGTFPPYDVMVVATAAKQWAGGSWKACTCTPGLTDCTCPRLFGAGRAVSHWVGYFNGHPQITGTDFPDGTNNADHNETVFPSDWDDDVFYHATVSVSLGGYTSGSIAVTLLSSASNTWNVHQCLTQ